MKISHRDCIELLLTALGTCTQRSGKCGLNMADLSQPLVVCNL